MTKLFFRKGNSKVVYLIAAICLFIGGVYTFLPFLADDSLITLRYAQRLVDVGQLTWTAGKEVEGYTNLLWLLLCAGFYALKIDLITAARLIGVISVLGVFFALYKHSLNKSTAAFALSILFVALSTPMQAWAIGGLEQPLYAVLLAWGLYYFFKFKEGVARPAALWISSFFFGLMALTRPDGPLFPFVIVFAALLYDFLSTRKISFVYLRLLLFPVLFGGLHTLFRYSYYGELVPNTAYVKIHFSLDRVWSGIEYLGAGILNQFPFSLIVFLILVVALIKGLRSFKLLVFSALLLAWATYLVLIGGDIFSAFRHLLVLNVISAFILVDFSHLLFDKIKAQVSPAIYLPVLSIFFVFHQHFTPVISTPIKKARRENWEWRGKEVGEFLKAHFREAEPSLAVTAAGCLPYWSEFNAVDLLGLNDYELPRKYPRNTNINYVGHDLGSPLFIYDKQPDIICFYIGMEEGGIFGYQEIEKDSTFQQLYHQVVFEIPSKVDGFYKQYSQSVMYLLKGSCRLGIRVQDNQIRIPAVYFSSRQAPAFEDEQGKLVCNILPGEDYTFPLDLPNLTQFKPYTGLTKNKLQYSIEQEGFLQKITITNTTGSAIAADVVEIPLPSVVLTNL